jgi:hypothetical protein
MPKGGEVAKIANVGGILLFIGDILSKKHDDIAQAPLSKPFDRLIKGCNGVIAPKYRMKMRTRTQQEQRHHAIQMFLFTT